MVEPPKRVKAVDDQVKYMKEKLLYYFPSDDDREVILEDFKRAIDSVRKNIGHYDYFITYVAKQVTYCSRISRTLFGNNW